MFIEEVILDGFKSYATRTVVGPFDTQFNAITGQNGTGKSNILDSICFVLGITSMAKVRVNSLTDLVFKSGQAGITKASVTLVLNNEDKSPGRSPIGYESFSRIEVCRQIVIGGRNRYMINGANAQLQQVQNLFHSVQLNVNNPHFLIMQGSISKVINMKPPEILGMIEEAAGTKMYENKRAEAVRTLERKQGRLAEIDRLLNEEVRPNLAKLSQERCEFEKWSALAAEVTRQERFVIGWDFNRLTFLLSPNLFKECENRILSLTEETEEIDTEISQTENTLAQKSARNDSLSSLESSASENSKKLATLEAQLKSKQQGLSKAVHAVGKGKAKDVRISLEIEEKELELNSFSADFSRSQLEINSILSALERAAGGAFSAQDTEAARELSLLNLEIDEAGGSFEAQKVKVRGLEAAVAQSSQIFKNSAKEMENLNRDKLSLERQVSECMSRSESAGFDENKAAEITSRLRETERRKREVESRREDTEAELRARLDFFYEPHPSIDQRAVRGAVGRSFSMKPEFSSFLPAVETVAGGRLLNVIVENDKTASALLKFGRARRRVTFLPLNRVQGKLLSSRQVEVAASIARSMGGIAVPALETIDFATAITPVMQYIFGSTFLCSTSEIAEKVCFADSVRARTVTPDGDSFDPMGSLSGGQVAGRVAGKMLSTVQASRDLSHELDRLSEEEGSLAAQFTKYQNMRKKADERNSELRALQSELAAVNKRLDDLLSRASDGTSEDSAKELLQSGMKRLSDLKAKLHELHQKRKDLQETVDAEGGGSIETQEKRRKKEVEKMGTRKKDLDGIVRKQEAELRKAEGELAQLKEELLETKNNIPTLESAVKDLEAQVIESEKMTASQRVQSIKASEALNVAKKAEENASNEQAALAKKINDLKTKKMELEHELTKAKDKISSLQTKQREARKTRDILQKANPWLESDTSDYSRVTEHGIEVARTNLASNKEEESILSKRVNKKVVGLHEKAERESSELLSKRSKVDSHRQRLETTIDEIDDQKSRSLAKTCQQVNFTFSSIFRSLLPNVNAKLEPPEGMTALEGLELRVAFGGVWKDSLTELSGGQKALLSLSLILALLRFKPAPFYILDEVDAALDISHTTNIGHMIKTHFPDSQFIIVSLKEGMFNNANVLFRTRFQDGTSMVGRSVMTGASIASNDLPKSNSESLTARKRKAIY